MSFTIYIGGLAAMLVWAVLTWLLSVSKRDVSIVDSIWSLMILTGGITYVISAEQYTLRTLVILGLLMAWALRLSIYLTWRNWGEPEDRRYQQIRNNHTPHFALKSLGIVFILQAVLAWIISLPLWPALTLASSWHALDTLALLLWLVGMSFETLGDWQLAKFKSNPANRGQVLDHGVWRYTRHPNYFGETLLWWGFYLFAVTVGAWWTLPAPLLMTWLLLKFSGVVMLEATIAERRPAYRNYIETTNTFIPGPRKQPARITSEGHST